MWVDTSSLTDLAPAVSMGEADGDASYGYGWVIDRPYGRDRVAHGGRIDGFTTSLARFPGEQVVIIATFSCTAGRT